MSLLSKIVRVTPAMSTPDRWLLHAGPGWGKTSFAAEFKDVIVVQSKGETGMETLIKYGQIQPTPHTPAAQNWTQGISYLNAIKDEPHEYRALAIDAINGFEQLLRPHIVAQNFDGNEQEFQSYGRGADLMAQEWMRMLALLDEIRRKRSMLILLLCHTKVKTFNNPTGNNYDRYTPEMNDKIFALTYKWVDGALFGAMETQVLNRRVKNVNEKVKVSSDTQSRILYTEETAAWSAKNRHGLPVEIDCGESAGDAYRAFAKALSAARKKGEANAKIAESQPEPVDATSAPQPAPSDAPISSPKSAPPHGIKSPGELTIWLRGSADKLPKDAAGQCVVLMRHLQNFGITAPKTDAMARSQQMAALVSDPAKLAEFVAAVEADVAQVERAHVTT